MTRGTWKRFRSVNRPVQESRAQNGDRSRPGVKLPPMSSTFFLLRIHRALHISVTLSKGGVALNESWVCFIFSKLPLEMTFVILYSAGIIGRNFLLFFCILDEVDKSLIVISSSPFLILGVCWKTFHKIIINENGKNQGKAMMFIYNLQVCA